MRSSRSRGRAPRRAVLEDAPHARALEGRRTYAGLPTRPSVAPGIRVFRGEAYWLRILLGEEPLGGLVAARELREHIEAHELRHVRALRRSGATWLVISLYAGVRRQSAWARWAHRVDHPSVRYPAAMSLDDLYREVILDHYRSPRNKRAIAEASIDVHRNNPLCGDDITVHVSVVDGVAADAAFEGVGCSISQASASMMTEQIKGKTLADVEKTVLLFRSMMAGEADPSDEELGDLVALKGVVKYPVRIKCAVLAWDALQAGVSGESE